MPWTIHPASQGFLVGFKDVTAIADAMFAQAQCVAPVSDTSFSPSCRLNGRSIWKRSFPVIVRTFGHVCCFMELPDYSCVLFLRVGD
jgi:hypothetical protein